MGNKFTRRRSHIDDRFTRPQGLYQHKDIDYKRLRRSIIDSKLAPCYLGAEDASNDLEECPICFLHYPSLNRSKCCTKEICTECFLQVKVPNASRPVQCPFCKTPNYAVDYKGAKTLEEKGVEQAEEQKVIEAKIRIRRQQEIEDQEARLQRQEQPPQEAPLPPPLPAEPHEASQEAPSFPVFSGSAYSAPIEPHPESWNAWPSADSTAIGYPQPDFFAFNPSALEPESPWHRGSQRGFPRHNPLSSSSVLSDRSLPTFHSRRRGGISGEPGQGPGAGFPSYTRYVDSHLCFRNEFAGLQRGGLRPGPGGYNGDGGDLALYPGSFLFRERADSDVVEQEQGPQQQQLQLPENSSETGLSSPFGALPYEIQEEQGLESSEVRGSRRGSVTGGFASAIAALAERQVAGSTAAMEEHVSESSESDSTSGTVVAQAEEAQTGVEQQQRGGSGSPSPGKVDVTLGTAATGSVSNSESSGVQEDSSQVVGTETDAVIEQGLESAGAGTSFCSGGPSSASEKEKQAAVGGTGAVDSPREVLPESFEEQMMLAMALSLAEAQAQAKLNSR